MNKIFDKFTNLPITASQRFVLRRIETGQCKECPDKATNQGRCQTHHARYLETKRRWAKNSYAARTKNGQCYKCGTAGKNPYCEDCLAAERKRYQERHH